MKQTRSDSEKVNTLAKLGMKAGRHILFDPETDNFEGCLSVMSFSAFQGHNIYLRKPKYNVQ